jgi:hypothetical protein
MGFNRIIVDYDKIKKCFTIGGLKLINETISKYDSVSVDSDKTAEILELVNNNDFCDTKKTLILNNIFYGN